MLPMQQMSGQAPDQSPLRLTTERLAVLSSPSSKAASEMEDSDSERRSLLDLSEELLQWTNPSKQYKVGTVPLAWEPGPKRNQIGLRSTWKNLPASLIAIEGGASRIGWMLVSRY